MMERKFRQRSRGATRVRIWRYSNSNALLQLLQRRRRVRRGLDRLRSFSDAHLAMGWRPASARSARSVDRSVRDAVACWSAISALTVFPIRAFLAAHWLPPTEQYW